jgi:hypothetical protein
MGLRQLAIAITTLALLIACSAQGIRLAPGEHAAIVKPAYQYYGDIFRANYTGNRYQNGSIDVYRGSNNPIATIAGSYTNIKQLTAIAVNAAGKIWASDFDDDVVVFPPGSNGNVAPTASIGGYKTGLTTGPTFSLAFGPGGNLWVGNEANFLSSPVGFVAVFRPDTNGNQYPLRWFESPKLLEPSGISFDPNGNAYITNGILDSQAALLVFDKNSSGPSVAPLDVLKSPKSPSGFVDWFAWGVAVDSHGSQCRTVTAGGWYTGKGGYGSGFWDQGYSGRIMIWNACPPNGTSDPDIFIKSSVLMQPRGVAVDPNGNIYIADSGANAIFEFSANAQGTATPIRTIQGGQAWGVALGPTY